MLIGISTVVYHFYSLYIFTYRYTFLPHRDQRLELVQVEVFQRQFIVIVFRPFFGSDSALLPRIHRKVVIYVCINDNYIMLYDHILYYLCFFHAVSTKTNYYSLTAQSTGAHTTRCYKI